METSKYFILFLILSVAYAKLISQETGASATVAGKIEANVVEMRFAGIADGKSFFACKNSSGGSTWFEAGEACQTMNMVLAEITSENQQSTIITSSNTGQIWNDTSYWTGGRDSQEMRQFSWNSTLSEFSLFNSVFYPPPAFATCILFRPKFLHYYAPMHKQT